MGRTGELRILLDTHTLLWAALADARLSADARTIIEDGANDIYLSAVTALEIAIKASNGRLELPEAPGPFVRHRINAFGLVELPIRVDHGTLLAELPMLHRDPFDRILVAQAQAEALPILTSDPNIARYNVDVIW